MQFSQILLKADAQQEWGLFQHQCLIQRYPVNISHSPLSVCEDQTRPFSPTPLQGTHSFFWKSFPKCLFGSTLLLGMTVHIYHSSLQIIIN